MSVVFNASNLHLGGNIDLTSTPQLLLTNNSTFNAASATATVTAQEVSGNGYARASLTVASNTLQPDGSYKLVYNLATFTASGGNIVFDRAVLYAQGIFVGWFQYGSTTIATGTTFPFRSISISQTDSGTLVNGLDGINAQALTTASFTQPAVNSTVAIALTSSAPFPVGSYCYFTDGTNIGWYKVTAYGSPTAITIENLGLGGSAIPTTTMAAGGTIVPSGREGVIGISGFGLRFTYSATTTSPAGAGQLRFNNASPGSATAIYIDAEDRNSVDVSAIVAALNTNSSLLVIDENDPAVWALFILTSVTDNGTNLTLAVTAIGAIGSLSGNVSLTFANKGNTGTTGSPGTVSSASGLTLTEVAEPSTPSANNLILYVDTADGLLKQKTDAGVVTKVGASGGASVTDIWLYGGF